MAAQDIRGLHLLKLESWTSMKEVYVSELL